ncbi:hypothetical protein [uncultured Draconibacterium sp.]
MGRYEHLKTTPKKKVSPIKKMQKIALVLMILLALVGLIVQLLHGLNKI